MFVLFRLRKWGKRLQFLLLFLALTFAMVQLVHAWKTWTVPRVSEHEPRGYAIKVIGNMDDIGQKKAGMLERLKLFFWIGE